MSSESGPNHPRNKLSVAETAQLVALALPLPAILPWTLVTSPFSSKFSRSRNWKIVLITKAILWLVSNSNRKQCRAIFGETRDSYDAFLKSQKWDPVVDDIGEDARLLWIGPKVTERVILHLHGGAFLFGVTPSAPAFWNHVRDNLAKRGKKAGIALLNYTFVPDGEFPTQLKQAIRALQYLLDSGVKPENIQLVGDSAGGNLIHQVLSHILHPVEGVPKLSLSAPLAGAYMMSPWMTLRDDPILHGNDGQDDMVYASTLAYWGGEVMKNCPSSSVPYVEANSAPEGWLEGVDKAVKRILISIGENEVLRDACFKYGKTLQKHHKDCSLFLDEGGVHVEPYLPFLVGVQDLGTVTPHLIDWMDQNFV
ncbi:hypothetical protein D9613_003874 [Agrocybe pediades]|uniref:Alpha/beta hydrolase fold-3 domain-containing protein n=1 Tax=Agrocybe pediades TaxID=84607 RepID=A0A8H4QIQ1_9AGAR|nr:hypothetical protein D9613_003874 [Agrocybe pediades]